MASREFVTVGYFPKHIAPSIAGVTNPVVKEICSVSECISKGPPGWIDHWKHNELGLFNTAAEAWSVVPGGVVNSDFTMFAYRMLPSVYDTGCESSFQLPLLTVQPIPTEYVRVGYDAICRFPYVAGFGCSPLSCNGRANDLPVNEHCLVDGLEAAIEFAMRFSSCISEGEPGPYLVLEVWRCPRR